jgi:thiamine-monophosphate kinase
MPETRLAAFMAQATAAGVAATVIGEVIAGDAPPRFVDAEGREIVLKRHSYSHF